MFYFFHLLARLHFLLSLRSPYSLLFLYFEKGITFVLNITSASFFFSFLCREAGLLVVFTPKTLSCYLTSVLYVEILGHLINVVMAISWKCDNKIIQSHSPHAKNNGAAWAL